MNDFFDLNPVDYECDMSLSKELLYCLGKIILEKDIHYILEFGTGHSTQFMMDLCETHLNDVKIDGVDHTPSYFDFNTYNNPDFNFIIRDLIECTDDDKNLMFETKTFDRNLFNNVITKIRWRQENRFYDISAKDDLKDHYDICIIDGPNGNGRVFAYLIIKDIVSAGSYIVIDDSLHYDFIERLDQIFKYETIMRVDSKDKNYMVIRLI